MSINIIGITGPSGAGKSILCTYLAEKNIPVIDADEVYHSLLVNNSPCTLALAEAFGYGILSADGTPDRKKLGAIVFSSDEKLEKLNSIVLKFVIDKINELIEALAQKGEKNVVIDAPTLIESGFSKQCDTVVSILAPKQKRIERIRVRDNISEESALLRINAQRCDEFYIDNSDFVIMNDSDTAALIASVDELFGRITKDTLSGGADE